jgi:hypothetical protein
MLKIEIEGGQLDLLSEKSISFALKSPLFNSNKIDGSYSFPFKIPATNNNKKLLGFTHRLTLDDNAMVDVEANIYFQGLKLFTGNLKVDGATSQDYYECTFYTDIGSFANAIKGKYLQDLELDGRYNYSAIYTNQDSIAKSALGSYPDYKFVIFPVANSKAQELMTKFGYTNIYNYQNNWIEKTGSTTIWKTENPITPFPYFIYVFEQVFKENGYIIKNDCFYKIEELQKLVIYNPNAITMLEISPSFYLKNHLPSITLNEFLINISNQFNCGYFINQRNKTIEIKFLKDIINSNESIDWNNNLLKPVYYPDIKSDGYLLKYTPDGSDDYWSSNQKVIEDFKKGILGSVSTFWDLYNILIFNGTKPHQIRLVRDEDNYYQKQIEAPWWTFSSKNFKNLDDGDEGFNLESKSSTLLMDTHSFIGLFPQGLHAQIILQFTDLPFNGQTFTLNWLGHSMLFTFMNVPLGPTDFQTYNNLADLKTEILTKLSYITTITDDFIISEGTSNLYYFNIVLGAKLAGSNFYLTVTTNTVTTLNPIDTTKRWLTPHSDQQLNYSDYKVYNDYTNFSLRLLFYRGLKLDSNDKLYPLASNDVYDFDGSKIADANLSLKWDGEYGLYENFWKDYIYWWNERKKLAKVTKLMSVTDIINLDWSKKYNIEGVNYLLKEISISIKNNQLLPAEIEMYKV